MENMILAEVSHDREGAKKTLIKSINIRTHLGVPGSYIQMSWEVGRCYIIRKFPAAK